VERTIADLSTANVVVPSLVAVTATAAAALRWRARPPRGFLWVARNHPARALLLAASTAMLLWVAVAGTREDRQRLEPAATSGV